MNKQGSNSNSNYPSIVEKEKGDKEFKEKNYEKALQFYSQALNIQPENSILYSNRSTVYFHLGNFQASLQDAEKCIQLDPQWIKGYYRKGSALFQLNKYGEAKLCFETALSIDPSNKECSSLLNACIYSIELTEIFQEYCQKYFIRVKWSESLSRPILITTKKIKKGEILFSEFPEIAIQYNHNQKIVNACSYCLKSLELPHETIQRYIPHRYINQESLPFLNECGISFSNQKYFCECKENFYCSELCKRIAWEKYHKKLCTKSHPNPNLIKKLQDFCKTNNNHIPLQVCSFLAQLLIFKEKSLPIERKLKFYQTDSDEKPVFAYFQSSHQFEDAFYSDLDFKIKQKGELMISGLIKKILDPDNKYPELFSYSMYRRILGIISMNSQGISPLSPYMQYWKSLASHISEENKMIAIQQLAQLIQDLPQNTSQLESSSGSALYSFVSCISHSCSPNVSIRFQKPDSTISLVAIRDIEEGEIINQCYIDAQVSVEERLLWLKVQYNIDCKCIRCIQETNNFRAIKNANILIEKHRSNFKDKSQKNAPLVSSIFNTDSNQKERIEEMDLDFILSFYYSSPLKLSLAEKKSLLQKKYFLPQIASLLTAVQQKKDFEKTFGFILEAKPSLIPTAGLGAFVKGTVKKGSIVCFYGGISIPQKEAQRIKQDPNFESYLIENSYLISRYDGVMIDGQYYKKKILTPLVYKSSEPNPFQENDNNLRNHHLGFGILINHPNWDYVPNVLPIAFDFPSNFPEELKPYIPVVDLNSKQNLPSVVVCVVTQDLCDQELFMDYRYPLSRNLPDWYVPLI